jgi:hypothetical protein
MVLMIAPLRAKSQQPVVKVRRCTENDEAPAWQGVTTENIGNI